MGTSQITTETPNKIPWLTQKQWNQISQISQIFPQLFGGLSKHLQENQEQWKQLYDSQNQNILKDPLWPQKIINNINMFHQLIILKILRPDKLIQGFQQLIIEYFSQKYIEFNANEYGNIFEECTNLKPIIFILSKGSEPRKEIENIARKFQMYQKLDLRTMGQGQGEGTSQAIKIGIEQGRWIMIQNCHLGISFMPQMLQIFENLPINTHPDFRLIFTLIPFEEFPVSILQKSIKVTYENPKGIKRCIQNAFQSYNWSEVQNSKKYQINRKLFYGLCFFHAIIQERIKFEQIGWNVPYEFNLSDLFISISQVVFFVEKQDIIQWDALSYLIAEVKQFNQLNYGGKVTDTNDRRLLNVILDQFFCPQLLNDNFQFSESGIYQKPKDGDYLVYMQQIQQIPLIDPPGIFGLHNNSQIQVAIKDAEQTCKILLQLMPRQFTSNENEQQELKEQCQGILDKLPQLFNLDNIRKKYPINYEQSMNVVLQQEVQRYNKLLQIVRYYMEQVLQTFEGIISLTNELEAILTSINNNNVPNIWNDYAYPSLKPLQSWILDLIRRLNFIGDWIQNDMPIVFWISGFFFTQSFFTGVLQNFSRKYDIPVDTLVFDFIPLKEKDPIYDLTEHPNNGCYIKGMFLEGCKWDPVTITIVDQDPNKVDFEMCEIYCETVKKEDLKENKNLYLCPMYRTSLRRGDLSSTGHSTNYILSIPLPIQKQHSPEFWVKRGVALICQLSD